MLKSLKQEGFIKNYEEDDKGEITNLLKYGRNGKRIKTWRIQSNQRTAKVLRLRIAIIST